MPVGRNNLPKAKRFGFSGFVPLYDLDGCIEKILSIKAVELLEAGERVTLVRNRKGLVMRAYRRRVDKRTNLTIAPYLGTSYSYEEHLYSGHRCSDLSRIGRQADGDNDKYYAPDWARPFFVQVIADCLTEAPAPCSVP